MKSASQRRRLQDEKFPAVYFPSKKGSIVALRPALQASFDDRSLSSQVLDCMQAAIAVVNGVRVVRFANNAMRVLTTTGDCAGIAPNGRLYFADRNVEAAFEYALENPQGGTTLVIKDGQGELRHLAILVPLMSGNEPLILITFSNVQASATQVHAEHLVQAFGLTPAEKRLARFLVAGGRLMEAAKTFALSRHTVRNQLRAIFAKTGVQRQADLTRLLCRY